MKKSSCFQCNFITVEYMYRKSESFIYMIFDIFNHKVFLFLSDIAAFACASSQRIMEALRFHMDVSELTTSHAFM